MIRDALNTAIEHVGLALRDPEDFALRYHREPPRHVFLIWAGLFATAVLGTLTYGMTMGLLGGVGDVGRKAVLCTLGAGLAWSLPLPALYILNSLAGSKLPAQSTLLAALVTTSWGGLAMIVSIPVNWFFTVAIPHPTFVLLVNLTVFTGVGVAMIDVFRRVMLRLEPERGSAPVWWIVLVGVIGAELFYSFGLFQFSVA
jgi:hypothetical protein